MFFEFKGTLADLLPTCMWKILINTFGFSIGLFIQKKKREREQKHGILGGLVSGVRFGMQLSETTDIHWPSISSFLFPHQCIPPPSGSYTLTHSPANSVAHSPLCLFCAGVATSLESAVLSLFFRREEGRNTLTEKAVFHSQCLETYKCTHM